MQKQSLLDLIRHVLTFGGGYLTAGNLASGNDVEAGVTAVVAVASLVWSILGRKKQQQADTPR